MNLKQINCIPDSLENKSFDPFQQVGIVDSITINEKFEAIRSNCKYFYSPLVHKPNNTTDKFNILHVNVRSILSDSKFEEFQLFVSCSNEQWHVICVSESWLSDEVVPMRQLVGYTGYFKNRTNKTGGGVIVYVSDKHIKCSSEIVVEDITMEALFVQCQLSTTLAVIVGQIYNPPSSETTTFIDELYHCLEKLDQRNKTTFLCGDFNLDLFSLLNDNHCRDFFNTLSSLGYWPSIFKTTRASDNKLSLLDNIFCNNLDILTKSGIIYDDSSDHFPVFVSCTLDLLPRKPGRKLVFDKNKYHELSAHLAEHLQHFTEISDPELACSALIDAYKSGILKFSIEIKQTRRSTLLKPWISPAILTSINQRHKLFLEKSRNPTEQNKCRYNVYRNKLNVILREAKKKILQNQLQINRANSKKLWQLLNETVRGNASQKPLPGTFINDHGEHISGKEDIAESFNHFFISIGEKLQQKIPPCVQDPLDYVPTQTEHVLNSMLHTNSTELVEIIQQMKNVGAGIDPINASIFKNTYPAIVNELVHFVNLCLTQGIFPSALKIAVVKPIFKSGDKKDFTNYRPISLLPYISKLLEKIIHLRIMSFLDNSNILNSCQFGFQKNKSTYMPLLLLQEYITKAWENGNIVCGMHLDLKKAFDTVDHEILVGKLEKYGFTNSPLKLIKSYLSNRQQCVEYDGVRSELKRVKIGVPQGSILGPLLFLIYINDFPNISKNLKFLLYADDTVIFFESKNAKSLQLLVNKESVHICNWLQLNKLSLNTQKTVYQVYTKEIARPDLSVHLNGFTINAEMKVRYLGVYIDPQLKWSSHIDHVSLLISKNIGIINRSKYFLDKHSLLLLYNALVLPYINYCCLVWGFAFPSYLNRIEILQKRAIRVIDGQHRLAHSDPIFKSLEILKVKDIAKQQLLTVMHKKFIGGLPTEIDALFTLSDPPSITTRTLRHFNETFSAKLYGTKIATWAGPRLWNSIITPHMSITDLRTASKHCIKTFTKRIFLLDYNR